MIVDLKIVNPKLTLMPRYATKGAAAVDLRSMRTVEIFPGQCAQVGTGIAVHIKDDRYVGIVTPRSGVGSKGIVLKNLTGVIDSDYQGEIKLMLWNTSDKTVTVTEGSRVAQMMLMPVKRMDFNLVKEFREETVRGTGGFGSTG